MPFHLEVLGHAAHLAAQNFAAQPACIDAQMLTDRFEAENAFVAGIGDPVELPLDSILMAFFLDYPNGILESGEQQSFFGAGGVAFVELGPLIRKNFVTYRDIINLNEFA